jgi:hypothetical protein
MENLLLVIAIAFVGVSAFLMWFVRDAIAKNVVLREELALATDRAEAYGQNAHEADEALQDMMAALRSAEAKAEALAASVIVVDAEPEPITEEQRQALQANRCLHCGGSHTIACPRVKRLRFRADGQTPLEVEFWPIDVWRDAWVEDRIVWPEDVA